MNQRIILSLPGDTNMIELSDAMASIGLWISSIAGKNGEIIVSKMAYYEPRITDTTEPTHEQQ